MPKEKIPERIGGLAFWALLIMQIPFPIMWMTKYNGIFFQMLLISCLMASGIARWKTTTYKLYIPMKMDDSEIMRYQERPWRILGVIIALIALPTLPNIIKDGTTSQTTVILCYVALASFAILGVIEGIRKIRIR